MGRSGQASRRTAVERGIDLRALGRPLPLPKPVPVEEPQAEELSLAPADGEASAPAAKRQRPPSPQSKQFLLDALERYGSHSSECYWQRGGDWCDCPLDDYLKKRVKLPYGQEGRADVLLRLGRHKDCGYTWGRDWCDCGFWDTVQRIDPTVNPQTGRRARPGEGGVGSPMY